MHISQTLLKVVYPVQEQKKQLKCSQNFIFDIWELNCSKTESINFVKIYLAKCFKTVSVWFFYKINTQKHVYYSK